MVDAVLPVMPPGLIVQFPAGSPLNTTLPVAAVQVGWVIVPTIGVAGNGFITTVVEPAALVHPPVVTVTLYTPASATVTLFIVGVLDVDVNPPGPVQL